MATRSLPAILRAALALALVVPVLAATAQDEVSISELSYLDRQYMSQQRAAVMELAATHLGRRLNGDTDNDLEVLQLLLDRDIVQPDMTRELQAMGIVLGDLLAQELGMDWVVYEDPVGRNRALRYRDTDNFLFPATMISRRQEGGSDTPVADIFRKAYLSIDRRREPLPFQ
jgi:hypothetical protein